MNKFMKVKDINTVRFIIPKSSMQPVIHNRVYINHNNDCDVDVVKMHYHNVIHDGKPAIYQHNANTCPLCEAFSKLNKAKLSLWQRFKNWVVSIFGE